MPLDSYDTPYEELLDDLLWALKEIKAKLSLLFPRLSLIPLPNSQPQLSLLPLQELSLSINLREFSEFKVRDISFSILLKVPDVIGNLDHTVRKRLYRLPLIEVKTKSLTKRFSLSELTLAPLHIPVSRSWRDKELKISLRLLTENFSEVTGSEKPEAYILTLNEEPLIHIWTSQLTTNLKPYHEPALEVKDTMSPEALTKLIESFPRDPIPLLFRTEADVYIVAEYSAPEEATGDITVRELGLMSKGMKQLLWTSYPTHLLPFMLSPAPSPVVSLIGRREPLLQILKSISKEYREPLSPTALAHLILLYAIYLDLRLTRQTSPIPTLLLSSIPTNSDKLHSAPLKPKLSAKLKLPNLLDIEQDDDDLIGPHFWVKPHEEIKVSIILPFTGDITTLRRTLDLIFSRGGDLTKIVEILLLTVVTTIKDSEWEELDVFSKLPHYTILRVEPRRLPYNYLAPAIEEATGKYTLFLMEHLEDVEDEWLDKLVGYAQRLPQVAFQPLITIGRKLHRALSPKRSLELPLTAAKTLLASPVAFPLDIRAMMVNTIYLKETFFQEEFPRSLKSFQGLASALTIRILKDSLRATFVPVKLTLRDKSGTPQQLLRLSGLSRSDLLIRMEGDELYLVRELLKVLREASDEVRRELIMYLIDIGSHPRGDLLPLLLEE